MKGYSYSPLPYCKWERSSLFWWFIFRSNSYTNRLKSRRFFPKIGLKLGRGNSFFIFLKKKQKQHMCILWLLVL